MKQEIVVRIHQTESILKLGLSKRQESLFGTRDFSLRRFAEKVTLKEQLCGPCEARDMKLKKYFFRHHRTCLFEYPRGYSSDNR